MGKVGSNPTNWKVPKFINIVQFHNSGSSLPPFSRGRGPGESVIWLQQMNESGTCITLDWLFFNIIESKEIKEI